jgi:nitrous oxide reductase
MRFQKGDRVVFTCTDCTSIDYLKHGTVINRFNSHGVQVQFDGEAPPSYVSWFYDSRFTLEALYDSPLNQALK